MNMNMKSGKGFYAALSLSIAMVGAACWYAYSQSGRQPARRGTESSTVQSQTSQLPAVTSQTTTLPTDIITEPRTEQTRSTEPAEEAAAVIRPDTTALSENTESAATTAPAELPVRPVEGGLLNPFSKGELVKSVTTGIWQTHNGADYAAALGTEVRCAADGTVTAVGKDALWGVCVSVLHGDGTVTRYCGLNEGLNVMAGQVLERGDVIGAVGATAESESLTEPHLHFEVRRNEAYIDPELFFQSAGQSQTTAVQE